MQGILESSRAILKKHGIDYEKGLENIHWAPWKGDSIKNAAKVRDALKRVDDLGGDAADIVNELKKLAAKWPNP